MAEPNQAFACEAITPLTKAVPAAAKIGSDRHRGLLRRYFPKRTDLAAVTQANLTSVARELNGRPRQTLDWIKPSEVFARTVGTTA